MFMKSLIFLLFFGSAFCRAGDAPNVALHGTWKCDPVTMVGTGFDLTLTSNKTYQRDGSYRGTSDVAVRVANGKVVRTRDRSFGSWTLKEDIIKVHYDKVEFLSSDDPAYTLKTGQMDADAQQKRKNWSKSKILTLDDKLVTVPVESMYKGAEVVVTCARR